MTNLVDFIPLLLQKTKQGKIEWDSLTSDSYVTRLGENSVEIGNSRSGFSRLSLLDVSGRTLESVSTASLSSPFDSQLSDLVEIARRKSLRIDETLEEVKSFLDRL